MLAAKLFFKHLFTGIRRRPAQPILLIIIIMFSVAVSISAFDIKGYFLRHLETTSDAENGKADLVVSCSPAMDERFLFVGQIDDVLPEGCDVCGVYKLPFYVGENSDFVYAVATDFNTVNSIFELEFIDIEAIGEKEIKESAYVSKEFAQSFGYKVGDTFTAELFGYKKNYVVRGITKDRIMNNYGIMVDVNGVTEQLLASSVSLQVLGSEFCPSVNLYVNSKGRTAEVQRLLRETLPRATVDTINWQNGALLSYLNLVIYLLTAISVLFAFAVTYSCFYVLSKQRAEENKLFYAVGTKQYVLNLMSVAEMFVYWLIGSALGIGLACPLDMIMISVIGFTDTTLSLSVSGVFISIFIMLAASECSIGGFIAVERWKKTAPRKVNEKKKDKMRLIEILTIAGLVLFFTVLATALPMAQKEVPSIIMTICLFVGSFLFAMQATNLLPQFLTRLRIKDKSLLYALKNTPKVMSLSNFSGLVSLLLALVFCVTVLAQFAAYQIDFSKEFINGDYLLVNANKSTAETIKEIDGTENADTIFFVTNIKSGEDTFIVVSFPEMYNFGEEYGPEVLPHGYQVVLPELVMKKKGLKEGDTWTLTYGEENYDLEIVGTWHTCFSFALIDNEALGIAGNYLLVDAKEDAPEDYYQNLLSKATENNVSVVPLETLMSVKNDEHALLLTYLYFAEIVMCLFAGIGIGNSLISGYRSRREEFECYFASGMNKTNLRKLKIYEILFAFLVGVVLTLILAALYWLGLYDLMMSMANDISYCLR